MGYGLFAARDFEKDEFIFHEAPLMTALFNEKFSEDKALMRSQACAYRAALTAHRDVTTIAFPVLAARFGIAPMPYDQAADVLALHLGRNLVPGHGRFAGSTVTREQYEAYTGSLPVANDPSERDIRYACLDFFKNYAFEVHHSTPGNSLIAATREACVYLLGSLINHCCTPPPPLIPKPRLSLHHKDHHRHRCRNRNSNVNPHSGTNGKPASFISSLSSTVASSAPSSSSSSSTTSSCDNDYENPELLGPNCTWRIGPSGLANFVRPRHLCVQARRRIRAGEQLTWDYGKREKGFECECDTCRAGFLAGLGHHCGVL